MPHFPPESTHMLSSRRDFLTAAGSTFAAMWLAADPDEIREALRYARRVAAGEVPAAWEFLTPEEAADVEAITSQVIPSEPDSPGAKEAGVVYFVDRALVTFDKAFQSDFRESLGKFNLEVAKTFPGAARFAGLSPARQIEFLKSHEDNPFFRQMRAGTMMGFFGNPSYGGNRDKVGWQLIGFEDRYVWQPPFGDYDRAGGR